MRISVREKTELKNALKLANLVYSGGEAKEVIREGLVSLNGEVCTKPGKKLFDGDKIIFNNETIEIICDGA